MSKSALIVTLYCYKMYRRCLLAGNVNTLLSEEMIMLKSIFYFGSVASQDFCYTAEVIIFMHSVVYLHMIKFLTSQVIPKHSALCEGHSVYFLAGLC